MNYMWVGWFIYDLAVGFFDIDFMIDHMWFLMLIVYFLGRFVRRMNSFTFVL